MALVAGRCDGTKTSAIRSGQDSVNDLALNQAAQKRDVLRSGQQIDQAAAGAEEAGRYLTGQHRRCVGRPVPHMHFVTFSSSRTTGISS